MYIQQHEFKIPTTPKDKEPDKPKRNGFLYGVVCRFFGHKWRYNFPSIPNKAICTRCKCKEVFDLKKLEWNKVDYFVGEKRTDEQLTRDWV